MKCPSCEAANREGVKFCERCGVRLELLCPHCNSTVPPSANFCGQCGRNLKAAAEPLQEFAIPKSESAGHPAEETLTSRAAAEGERKHVTVLFSDLSGYTAMSERLDPEEVREIMSRIFGEIAQVVTRYEGFIEKFVGDAVMALFGIPKAHEDDPLRAIRAAREIHDLVETMNPRLKERVGQPLSVHTGINTGLVVTGGADLEKGIHGASGDTINLASRLCGQAGAGEVLVGPETCRQSEGYFHFEALEPVGVKGRAQPVPVYRVISAKEKPTSVHRPSGLRSALIGRRVELAQLQEAVELVRRGKGAILSICGDAGTGKSRLVEEFRATLDLETIQWREGHAYAYSQNIPYSVLIDLLSRAWGIEEADPPEAVREKIESAAEGLSGGGEDVVPYVGSLYALSYPGLEGVSPEYWKSRLQESVQALLAALGQKAPTVICLEDIHWADPSSLELIRYLLVELKHPALFLCVYRPPFSLLASHELSGVGKAYQEIRLQDLSPSETQDMLESLLVARALPTELRRFIQEKVEGNPFYLEEVVSSMVESGALIRDNGSWKLARPLAEADVPPTLHGVISARLDRLEDEAKRILQEASVIGRSFPHQILDRITALREHLDRCLGGLERLDLIRTRSLYPALEYVFKHALTQEVAYNGLLRKDRQAIHERIALVMEQLFHDRLPEFYETLALHFKRGQSINKAVEYLVKSGEKSLKRYAVEESHLYFKEAFDLLANRPHKTKEEEEVLIDLIVKWAFVFYYRGDFKGLTGLLTSHEELAQSLYDRARFGMFLAWLGFALWGRERFKDSYGYLHKALKLGEDTGDRRLIGYACAWLTWTCADLGLMEEAVLHGERAQEISSFLESDHYLYFKSLGGLGYAYWFMGERKKVQEVGEALVSYGRRHSNVRSTVMGHYITGHSYLIAGDYPLAAECYERAAKVAADPMYSQFPKLFLGICYIMNNQFQEGEDVLKEVSVFSESFGCESFGTPADFFLGLALIAKGHMSRGIAMVEAANRANVESGAISRYVISEYVMGKLYSQIAEGSTVVSLPTAFRNIGFLARNVPFASRKAEDHFNKAIEVAREVGAHNVLGEAYLDLGLLQKAKGKRDRAAELISMAIQLFERCEAETLLRQAREALASLRQ